MEVLFTLFRIISAFSVDILYEISMVNGLFKFDLDKKTVIFKEDLFKNKKSTSILKKKEKHKESERSEKSEKSGVEESEKQSDNDIIITNAKKNSNHKTSKISTYKRNISRNDFTNSNLTNSKSKAYNPEFESDYKKMYNKRENTENNNKNNIISKVRLNRAGIYLWFCFVRRGKNKDNVLLDEGMDLISKRLDVFNLIDKMNKAEQRNEPLLNKEFSMTDECKRGLNLLRLETNGSGGSNGSDI